LDGHVDAPAAVVEYAEAMGGETELRIAANAAQLVRDGDTLQFGIGAVPMGLAQALRSHRKLRLHTGMVSRALQTLWNAGALDSDARITTGVVLGDAQFQAFATGLESLWLTDVRHTHDPSRVACIPRFVAVNGAVEVDLFGQANSERAAGGLQAGAGGLPAFAQGALHSRGGRLIICLPATARKGTVSRIVAALDGQSLCTVPRYLADAVVTEYGMAEIRDLSLHRRAEALIGIAAPDHRAALAEAWDLMRRSL
jgi:acyl-CoA hydrolase